VNSRVPDTTATAKANAAANEEHLTTGETFLVLAALSAVALSLLSFTWL